MYCEENSRLFQHVSCQSSGNTRALLFLLPPTAAFTKYILGRELHFSTPFSAQSSLHKHHQAHSGHAVRQH